MFVSSLLTLALCSAVLAGWLKDTHGITDRFPKDVSITNRRPQCLSTGGVEVDEEAGRRSRTSTGINRLVARVLLRSLLICNVRVGIIFIAGSAEEDATQTIFRCEGLGTYMYLLSYYSLSLLLVLIRNPILGPSVNPEVPQLETAGGRMRWAYIR